AGFSWGLCGWLERFREDGFFPYQTSQTKPLCFYPRKPRRFGAPLVENPRDERNLASSRWAIYFGCLPENERKANQSTFEILRRIAGLLHRQRKPPICPRRIYKPARTTTRIRSIHVL